MSKKLVLATANRGKIAEVIELLAGLQARVLTLKEYPYLSLPEEDQPTFRGNAILKAEAVSAYTGEMALADDSGLIVPVLGGRPGVHSARYAGPGATSAANNKLLLDEMKGLPPEKRKARFFCIIALSLPGEKTYTVKGSCPGRIAVSPSGEGGFGYDPLFIYEPKGKTFAEMSRAEKNLISHRGRALRNLRGLLVQLFG